LDCCRGEQTNERVEFRARFPAEDFAGAGGVAAVVTNLGAADERAVDDDVLTIVEIEFLERGGSEIFDGVTLAGRDHEVVGLRLLQHLPHRLDGFRRVAPIAPRGEIAEVKFVGRVTGGDRGGAGDDLLRDERRRAQRRLVIEHDARAGEESVFLARFARRFIRGYFRFGVRTARRERRVLVARGSKGCVAEAFARRGVIHARSWCDVANGVEEKFVRVGDRQPCGRGIGEGKRDGAESGEVVDFVGATGVDDVSHRVGIRRRNAVHDDAIVDAGRPCGVARRSVHCVVFLEEEAREISTVLARHAEDQRRFHRRRCIIRDG